MKEYIYSIVSNINVSYNKLQAMMYLCDYNIHKSNGYTILDDVYIKDNLTTRVDGIDVYINELIKEGYIVYKEGVFYKSKDMDVIEIPSSALVLIEYICMNSNNKSTVELMDIIKNTQPFIDGIEGRYIKIF